MAVARGLPGRASRAPTASTTAVCGTVTPPRCAISMATRRSTACISSTHSPRVGGVPTRTTPTATCITSIRPTARPTRRRITCRWARLRVLRASTTAFPKSGITVSVPTIPTAVSNRPTSTRATLPGPTSMWSRPTKICMTIGNRPWSTTIPIRCGRIGPATSCSSGTGRTRRANVRWLATTRSIPYRAIATLISITPTWSNMCGATTWARLTLSPKRRPPSWRCPATASRSTWG